MTGVVLDTDVVSFLFKNDSRANLYRNHLRGKHPVISFMTVAELDRWGLARDWGRARLAQMSAHLRKFVVHPYNRDLCRFWAEVSEEAKQNGHPIGCADAWIAATARLHNIPLITHNGKDYRGVRRLHVISGS